MIPNLENLQNCVRMFEITSNVARSLKTNQMLLNFQKYYKMFTNL